MESATDPALAGDAAATTWRLLVTGPSPASWNMACDHVLTEDVSRGASPVLRLYAWSPPAISFGYNQPLRPLRDRLDALRERGIGAVRRPTGGRAVLHAAEVTYSVIARDDVFASGVDESCGRIHAAILRGLSSLGVTDLALHAGPATRVGPREALACFAGAGTTEIVWRGRKLVGSAQRRLPGAVLQHGSILLEGDQLLLEELWPGGSADERTATLAQAGGRRFEFREVASAVAAGFRAELGVDLEPAELDREFAARVEDWIARRYGREEFLYRV